jgi:hypothetical protein
MYRIFLFFKKKLGVQFSTNLAKLSNKFVSALIFAARPFCEELFIYLFSGIVGTE